MRLSVVTTCSDAVSRQFYLKELIESVWDIADEIIIVNGDEFEDGEVLSVIYDNFVTGERVSNCGDFGVDKKIKMYFNPWEERMGCIMPRIQKSIAISHAEGDYILVLDADEVCHQKDHEKIIQCMEKGHFAYATRTLHFYRDYDHLISGGEAWYNYRTRLFKNNKAIFDMHDSHSGYDCGLIFYNFAEKEEDRRYLPLSEHPDTKRTSIEIFHYGHTARRGYYIEKKNRIERMYHPDKWKDLDSWEWDMSNTIKFEGAHPEVMEQRIIDDNC